MSKFSFPSYGKGTANANANSANKSKSDNLNNARTDDWDARSTMSASSLASPMTERKRMKSLIHHSKYYIGGGDLYIMIGITIFKVHSHFFRREAKSFYSTLDADATSPGDDTTKGLSENTALIIENATVEEFEWFLWVFYNPTYGIYTAPISAWFSILRLAHEWSFPQVKNFALRELKRREAETALVPRIVLYREYHAPLEYIVPLYGQLCARGLPPTDEEVEMLGLGETVKVFRAREAVRAGTSGASGSTSPLPEGMSETDTYLAVAAVFGVPDYTHVEVDDGGAVKGSPRTRKNTNGRTRVN